MAWEQDDPWSGGPEPRVVFQDPEAPAERWLVLSDLVEVVQAGRLDEVRPALARVEDAVAGGLFAGGFLCYEAAPAFDPACVTRAPGPLPLLWFGLFSRCEMLAAEPTAARGDDTRPTGALPTGHTRLWPTARMPTLPATAGAAQRTSRPGLAPGAAVSLFEVSDWETSLGEEEHRRGVEAIRAWIARGHTYQLNYTHRLRARFAGDAWAFCRALWRAQGGSHGAFLDLGRHQICSASPELFFRLQGARIVSRPMKGTAARGLTAEDDVRREAALAASPKDRAENVMIVDMVRNDLGRVARPGSVRVPRLFEVERYDSLLQLTSTVEAETDAPLPDLLAALFPCASVTGAPKPRTMQLIAELEGEPRGIYTGAIGWLAPGRRAHFNVAIRTVHVDREKGLAEFGTGGGVVWDSSPEAEYRECRTKAVFLSRRRPDLLLLETLLWRPARGYALLERHLDRLLASARYFGFPSDPVAIRQALARLETGLGGGAHRVRLLVAADGAPRLEAQPLERRPRRWRLALARRPIAAGDRFLYHKTTHRPVYEAARADFPEHDEVLLGNEADELTEATTATLVVRLAGRLWTPPVDCGLLPGTYRAELLARGRILERRLRPADLAAAEAVYLVNSVRGWIPVAEIEGLWRRSAGRPAGQTCPPSSHERASQNDRQRRGALG